MSERKIIRVRDVMKTHLDFVDGLETISSALQKMQHVDTKCLIVRKRHDDDEYGMLLLSDIARHVLATDRSPERVNVYEVMTKPVICVDPAMDIRYCARLFDRFDLTRAPVIDNGEVTGIVSFNDMVLKGFANQRAK